jgi:hypothetical protein
MFLLGSKKATVSGGLCALKMWYCYEMHELMNINPIALGGVIVFLIIAFLNRS